MQIKDGFGDGKDLVVSVMSAMGEEQISALKDIGPKWLLIMCWNVYKTKICCQTVAYWGLIMEIVADHGKWRLVFYVTFAIIIFK